MWNLVVETASKQVFSSLNIQKRNFLGQKIGKESPPEEQRRKTKTRIKKDIDQR